MSLINDNTYGDYNIRLKTLEKEYQVILSQYLETKNAYIQALQEKSKDNLSYLMKEKTAIDGSYSKLISNITNAEKCKALCAENKCKGATYDTETKNCSFYNMELGTFRLVPNQYTTIILPSDMEKLRVLGQIIQKLLNINAQIIQTIENIDPSYVEDIEAKKTRGEELYKNYKALINERNVVNAKLDEYNTLAQKFTEENINADKQYNLMNIFWFLVIFLTLFVLREMFSLPINFIPIFILSFVFFLTLNLGIPTGFLIWLGVVGLLIFLYFMNMA